MNVYKYVWSHFSSYFDSPLVMGDSENTMYYLFDDTQKILFFTIVRDGQCGFLLKKFIKYRSKEFEQADETFLEDHQRLKESIWAQYALLFLNTSPSAVTIKMKYNSLAAKGEYTLLLKSSVLEQFKDRLKDDMIVIQNLMDHKRYKTIFP